MHRSHNASSNSAGNEKRSHVEWARFWFAQLARHHRVHDPAKWSFTEQDVIAFLRAKRPRRNNLNNRPIMLDQLPDGILTADER